MKKTYLKLQSLGSFLIDVAGTEVEKFRTVRSKELLIYLALNPEGASRSFLANFFWPDKDEKKQQVNLRQAISQLIKPIGEEFFIVDDHSIQLNWDTNIFLDVQEFFDAYEYEKLEAAEKLFSGDLVPGFSMLSDEPDKWLNAERIRVRKAALDVLHQLTERRLEQMDYPAAIESARRQLELDPLRESATFQLMQACAYSGQREDAIAAFDALEEILANKLSISPKHETFALLREIEKGEIGTPLTAIPPSLPAPFMAPAVPDYLTGRDAEIATLIDTLTKDEHKIVGLVGMGGIGKTTLAAATAHQLKETFPDGILWGSLNDSSTENVLKLWGQAFGRDYSALSDLNSLAIAVRNTLADKRVLIVLDNVENEMTLEPFMQTGDRCRILLTTRDHDAAAAVNAHPFKVDELSQASSLEIMSQILDRPELPSDPTAQAICDLLEYLPLAVEITAQLLKARPGMTLEHMLERLQKAQHRLGLKIAGNRGIRPTFEVSWEILNGPQQALFSSVGIFEGRSFTLEAAETLVEADPLDTVDDLHSLVALSLVKWSEADGRFKQHPLLADFAREKLEDDRPTWGRLVDYYLNYAETNALNYEALTPEWDNLLATILGLEKLEGWEQILRFTDLLHESWLRFGRFSDTDQIYPLAESAAKKLGEEEHLAQNLLYWSEVGIEQSNYDETWKRLEQANSIFLRLEHESGIAKVCYFQGFLLYDQGEYSKAKTLVLKSVSMFKDQDDPLKLGEARSLIGWILFESDKDLSKTKSFAHKTQEIIKHTRPQIELISTLRLLGCIAYKEENYQNAEQLIKKSILIAKKYSATNEEIASTYWLVCIYRRKELFEEAINLSTNTLLIAQQIGALRTEGMLIQELASINLILGAVEKAKDYCLFLLDLFEKIEDRLNFGYTLCRLGEIHHKLNQHKKSKDYFEQAKAVAIHIGHEHLESIVDKLTYQLSNS